MNEVSTQNQFSLSLQTALEESRDALPADFNIARFVQNSIALLNGNESLIEFGKKYGTAQIKAGLLTGAYQGLDAFNQEMYLVPYGSKLNYMPSYKGMVKMAIKNSQKPVKSIYAKLVREGDEFEEVIVKGEPSVNFKAIPFSTAPIIGAFAVCLFEDGGAIVETMSEADIEKCRKQSKAKNSPAWSQFGARWQRKLSSAGCVKTSALTWMRKPESSLIPAQRSKRILLKSPKETSRKTKISPTLSLMMRPDYRAKLPWKLALFEE